MRRCTSVSIGDYISAVMHQSMPQMEEKLAEIHLVQNWYDILGPLTQKYTEKAEIRNHILYVRMTSAAVRAELFNARQSVVEKLNASVGRAVISDLKFF